MTFPGNLARSLITLKSAKSLKMKLTKKQCPCLTLEIEIVSIFSIAIIIIIYSTQAALGADACIS